MEKEKCEMSTEEYRKYVHMFCDKITNSTLLKRLYYIAQHYWLNDEYERFSRNKNL